MAHSGAIRASPGCGLRRERYGSRSTERAGELGEDRQVGVKPNPVPATDPERKQRPLMLEPPELPLDRAARAVKVARALGLARDERVQPVGLDPTGRRAGTRRSGSATWSPCACSRLRRTSTSPCSHVGALVIAALDGRRLAQRRDGADAPVHAAVVERAVVIALVHDRRLDLEPTLARSVDQRQRKVRLGRARRLDGPSDGQAGRWCRRRRGPCSRRSRRPCASRQRSGAPSDASGSL